MAYGLQTQSKIESFRAGHETPPRLTKCALSAVLRRLQAFNARQLASQGACDVRIEVNHPACMDIVQRYCP
jgi:hypothetical protein